MSQLNIQIVFVAIFVLLAFDDGPKSGPVKIRSLFVPMFKFKYEFVTFHRSRWCELGRHKVLDNPNARLLPQHGCPGIVSKQKWNDATDCPANVFNGKFTVKGYFLNSSSSHPPIFPIQFDYDEKKQYICSARIVNIYMLYPICKRIRFTSGLKATDNEMHLKRIQKQRESIQKPR